MLNVVEHFTSIQGEGKYAGRFSLFIRLAGCNLSCKGFGCELKSPKTGEILVGCDTIRAVVTRHFDYFKFDFLGLKNLVENTKFKPIIVITGGEPMLHHKDEDLLKFVGWLLESGYEVHFETNGTVFVDFAKFEVYKKCEFAISPKLALSGEPKERRIKPEALKSLFVNAECFYKFVISNEDALKEIKEILSIQDGEVWCMPLAKNQEQLNQNAQKTAQICIEHGYNYCDRLHIRLWNDKDGV